MRCDLRTLDAFRNVVGRVRDRSRASIPEDRVTIEADEVVGGVSPGDIDRIITRPHTRGMAGAVNAGWVSRCDGIDIEWAEVNGRFPVTDIVNATDVEVVAIALGQLRTGDVASPSLNVLSLVRDSGRTRVPEDGVAIKATEVVGGVSPVDVNLIIT